MSFGAEQAAASVRIVGSWNEWSCEGTPADRIGPGLWQATIGPLEPGDYAYKLVIDVTSGSKTPPIGVASLTDSAESNHCLMMHEIC
jgi:hypothetical protein